MATRKYREYEKPAAGGDTSFITPKRGIEALAVILYHHVEEAIEGSLQESSETIHPAPGSKQKETICSHVEFAQDVDLFPDPTAKLEQFFFPLFARLPIPLREAICEQVLHHLLRNKRWHHQHIHSTVAALLESSQKASKHEIASTVIEQLKKDEWGESLAVILKTPCTVVMNFRIGETCAKKLAEFEKKAPDNNTEEKRIHYLLSEDSVYYRIIKPMAIYMSHHTGHQEDVVFHFLAKLALKWMSQGLNILWIDPMYFMDNALMKSPEALKQFYSDYKGKQNEEEQIAFVKEYNSPSEMVRSLTKSTDLDPDNATLNLSPSNFKLFYRCFEQEFIKRAEDLHIDKSELENNPYMQSLNEILAPKETKAVPVKKHGSFFRLPGNKSDTVTRKAQQSATDDVLDKKTKRLSIRGFAKIFKPKPSSNHTPEDDLRAQSVGAIHMSYSMNNIDPSSDDSFSEFQKALSESIIQASIPKPNAPASAAAASPATHVGQPKGKSLSSFSADRVKQ